MAAVFITGTGTGVGKTFITARLIERARVRGRTVRPLKPVCSGIDPAAPTGSDPALLVAAAGREPTPIAIAAICPFALRAPLSPDMAARREGRAVDVAALAAFHRAQIAEAGDDLLLVEGVGGVMVPLNERETVLDWVAALGAPALVVAGAYLGTLSHTLTAVSALRQRSCSVLAVVVNEIEPGPVPVEETCASLRAHLDELPVLPLTRDADPSLREVHLDAILDLAPQ